MRTDEGAAAVEMAIVLPLLLLILFGIIDFGLLLNRQLLLTEAAREGARVVALDPGADAGATIATILGTAPTTTAITGCPADARPGDAATVRLTYRYATSTPLGSIMLLFGPGAGDTFELTATGVMACVG